MKKLLSMLLVVAMIASMSLVAFAAETNTMSVEVVETDDGIVATFYITNPANVLAFTAAVAFDSAKVTADKNTAYTLGDDFAGSTVSPGSKAGNVKFAQTFGTATDRAVTKSGKVVAISFPFTRVDAEADLTNVFAYGTGMYVSKVGLGDNTAYDNSKNPDYFVAPVYVDNRTPVGGGETPEEPGDDPVVTPTWNASSEDVSEENKTAWNGAFKYKDSESNDATAYTGKKVTIFGKNASGAVLAAETYGVKIGERYYPGKESVAAGGVFAIIILDTTGKRISVEDGSYTIWTGTANAGEQTVYTGEFIVE